MKRRRLVTASQTYVQWRGGPPSTSPPGRSGRGSTPASRPRRLMVSRQLIKISPSHYCPAVWYRSFLTMSRIHALFQNASVVRIGGLHIPSRTSWNPLRYLALFRYLHICAGFLMMFIFIFKASNLVAGKMKSVNEAPLVDL